MSDRKNILKHLIDNWNWTGMILVGVYWFFCILSVWVVVRIIDIQFFWNPGRELDVFRTVTSSKKEIPERGDILSYDGKILATSEDFYQISMDCTIQKENWESMRDHKKGRENEEKWREGAVVLSGQLAALFKDRSADEYYRMITGYRDGKARGRKKVRIGGPISYQTLLEVKGFELFREGRNYGGLIIDTIHTRQYPYGSLARKAIGEVKNNMEVTNDLTGIEGKYNYVLHGRDGLIRLRRTDSREYIQDYSRTSIPAENGHDVRTTLNIEFQNIADKALRKVIEANDEIAGGCVMIMETSTGAIRAMANLRKDSEGRIGETYNYVMWQANNPGSVFKAVTLTMLIDEGKVRLDDMVPTFGGRWAYKGDELPSDDYITRNLYPSGYVSVGQGLAISSNHVFRYLACQHYGDNPEKFIEKLYEYKLLEKYDFDIEGLATPSVLKPKDRGWGLSTLPSIAMGYSVNVTPLHIITFYNAIANNGKMMKPYMVEDLEDNGRIVQKMGPEVLNGAICKPSTVEELKKGLLLVTELVEEGRHHSGTAAANFKGSKIRVAGKTGTSRIEFEYMKNGKKVYGREDTEGRHVHQGSFVGFFPVEDPQYTVMSVTYSKPTHYNVYGAISSKVVREISDALYLLCPEWGEPLTASGKVPAMEKTVPQANRRGEVPDVGGLGLSDAIYAIENSGYVCSYSGCGHVKTQTPAARERLSQGGTIRITLE